MIKFVTDNPIGKDLQVYQQVIKVASLYDIDPSSSFQAERFFQWLLSQYEGDLSNLTSWLNEQIPFYYKSFSARPKWIQSSEWVYIDEKPAIFMGQIDIPVSNKIASEIFHDDVSFYIFIGNNGQIQVIMQQF